MAPVDGNRTTPWEEPRRLDEDVWFNPWTNHPVDDGRTFQHKAPAALETMPASQRLVEEEATSSPGRMVQAPSILLPSLVQDFRAEFTAKRLYGDAVMSSSLTPAARASQTRPHRSTPLWPVSPSSNLCSDTTTSAVSSYRTARWPVPSSSSQHHSSVVASGALATVTDLKETQPDRQPRVPLPMGDFQKVLDMLEEQRRSVEAVINAEMRLKTFWTM
ncbi:hypothetical protein ColLi_13109 [Colletotrichum liriopes]|uniref:Uncharacterized protein n=1 Tax=Colletotrichum liriopes TaxID=708192 RepID=A0AA37GZL2_9PEZI|nr:hypothetical protein ColLi_13109 [Colletotrichum liriopes]